MGGFQLSSLSFVYKNGHQTPKRGNPNLCRLTRGTTSWATLGPRGGDKQYTKSQNQLFPKKIPHFRRLVFLRGWVTSFPLKFSYISSEMQRLQSTSCYFVVASSSSSGPLRPAPLSPGGPRAVRGCTGGDFHASASGVPLLIETLPNV